MRRKMTRGRQTSSEITMLQNPLCWIDSHYSTRCAACAELGCTKSECGVDSTNFRNFQMISTQSRKANVHLLTNKSIGLVLLNLRLARPNLSQQRPSTPVRWPPGEDDRPSASTTTDDAFVL